MHKPEKSFELIKTIKKGVERVEVKMLEKKDEKTKKMIENK